MLDPGRVLTEDQGRDPVMNIGLDRAGAEPGLAQAGRAVVRVQQDPEQVGVFGQPQGLDGVDLHR